VVAALGANTFITVIKFVAFAFSGSGAMLSEAIHSLADAGNQALLLIGLRRGARERDHAFHYGYGGERFIFGMLSASGIFFIGCGVTVYHGVQGLLSPHMPEIGVLTWAVLGTSLVLEGASTLFACKTMLAHRPPGYPMRRYVRERVDPAALAILLEDAAAIVGLLLAALGIVLAFVTHNPVFDALGSIVVGLLLGYIAIHLVKENRELLLGKAVPEGVEAKFTAIVTSFPSVKAIFDVKTRQLTPEVYTLKAEVIFNDAFLAKHLDAAIPHDAATLAGEGRAAILKGAAHIALNAMSDEVDAIEAAVRQQIPEARHIDLEIDQTPEADDARPARVATAALS
jgi:zinc transporter 9